MNNNQNQYQAAKEVTALDRMLTVLDSALRALFFMGVPMTEVDAIVNAAKIDAEITRRQVADSNFLRSLTTSVPNETDTEPLEPDHDPKAPLFDFGFDQRAVTALNNNGITTIGELLRLTLTELLGLNRIGVTTADSIIDTLRKHGLILKEDQE